MKKLLLISALMLLFTGCSVDKPSNNTSLNPDTMNTENTTKKNNETPKKVVLHTSEGDITIKLLPDSAPQTVESFWKLSRDGKYDNVIFHRVIKGFMIQTGDYENNNGTGGKSWFGSEMDNEIDKKLSHKRGMVSMANRGPNTNGSQFFIVHQDAPHLDGAYSIFGEVIEGMETVDKIAETKTAAMNKPIKDIFIEKTSLEF